MDKQLIEAGQIVNTHGLNGEVRIQPWCDSPQFLMQFDSFYIDGKPVKIKNLRLHKSFVLSVFEEIDNINDAMRLKGKTIYIDKNQVALEPGQYFVQDLIGLKVIDSDTKNEIGIIDDVINLPANDVYVVHGEGEYMIPAVSEFILEYRLDEGYIVAKLLEGMRTDEN